ncbi:MAG: FeoB-associated Cys-rich membrane protein [Anaerovoracaceae bacterium]|nr:FeoB-associated Cys-rich membrane protein [Anaerovoracaceae bacterium]
MIANIIVGAIILISVGAALSYIVRQKKKGVKCIGCPDSGGCAHCSCSGCSSEKK